MGPLAARLLDYSPEAVKRNALVWLFRATAAAFGCVTPTLQGLSREQCLSAYTMFTTDHAEAALTSSDGLAALQERLYGSAYRLGRVPGRLLCVRSVADVMTLGHFLYGILDIEFAGSGSGEIAIPRCHFSSFYSPEVCRLMSAMDRGLLAGLAGGGELVFWQRITEGQSCCRARFIPAAQTPDPARTE